MSRSSKAVVISSIMVVIIMLLASIEPLEWSSYLLHQAGTLVFLAMLLALYRYWQITSRAYVLATFVNSYCRGTLLVFVRTL